MNRWSPLLAAALASLACGMPAHAAWKWYQPWTPPRASHDSVVLNCAGAAVPFAPIALDDWKCGSSGPIIKVRWWGSLEPSATMQNAPTQFHIAVWSESATACRPAAKIYSACVSPTRVRVGTDCEDREVWRFVASLPSPFTQTVGTKYWLQISEVDVSSPRQGLPEWRWSAHRPLRECDAVQLTGGGALIQPLFDPCDANKNDLAFHLESRGVSGGVGLRNLLPPPILTADVRHPVNGALLERHMIEPAADGSFEFSPEAADGTVVLVFKAPGALPVQRTVILAEGQETNIGLLNPVYGDANDDGRINFLDVTQVLVGFGLP